MDTLSPGLGSPAGRALRPRAHFLVSSENGALASPRSKSVANRMVIGNGKLASPARTPLGLHAENLALSPLSPRRLAAKVQSPLATRTRQHKPVAVFVDDADVKPVKAPMRKARAVQVDEETLSITGNNCYDPEHADAPVVLRAARTRRPARKLHSPIRGDSARVKDNLLVDSFGFTHERGADGLPSDAVSYREAMPRWSTLAMTEQGAKWKEALQVSAVCEANPSVSYVKNKYVLANYLSVHDDPNHSAVMHTILQDIPRTYTTHVLFFDETCAMRQTLFNVLVTYSTAVPAVGYCQGMSYLVGALLMHMPEEDAFWALYALLSSKTHLEGFYDPELSELQCKADVYESLLETHDPELASHLQGSGLVSLMYVTQWFMRVYTCLPNWNLALFALDTVIRGGYASLVQLALEIVRLCRAEILAQPTINTLLPLLHNIPLSIVTVSALSNAMLAPLVAASDVTQAYTKVSAERAQRAREMQERRLARKRESSSGAETPSASSKRARVQPSQSGYLDRLVRHVTTPFKSRATAAAPVSVRRSPRFTPAAKPAPSVTASASASLARMRSPTTFSPTSSRSFTTFATPTPLRDRNTRRLAAEEEDMQAALLATPPSERHELVAFSLSSADLSLCGIPQLYL